MPATPDPDVRLREIEALAREMTQVQDAASAEARLDRVLRAACGPRALLLVASADDDPDAFFLMRFVDEKGSVRIEDGDLLQPAADAPRRRGGFLGALLAVGRAQRLGDLRVSEDPALGDLLAPYRSLILVPIYADGRLRRWWIVLHPEPDHFRPEDLEQAVLRANVFSTSVLNQRLRADLERATRWIRDEVDQLGLVQRALLPDPLPEIPGIDLAARWETFDRAGGDTYDLRSWRAGTTDEVRWTWLVADGSGHGPAAAVLVAMLHVLLRNLPPPTAGPGQLLRDLNERLLACPSCNHFVTAFAACYAPSSRELRFASAGHPPPLRRRPDGTVARLTVDPAVPLGILGGLDPPVAAVRLDPGDLLLLYTDGLTDAQGAQREAFGEARLARALAEAQGSADRVLGQVFQAVRRHEAGRRPIDDQTAILVRVLDP